MRTGLADCQAAGDDLFTHERLARRDLAPDGLSKTNGPAKDVRRLRSSAAAMNPFWPAAAENFRAVTMQAAKDARLVGRNEFTIHGVTVAVVVL